MQLVDELSMIYTTCLMLYASLAYSRSRCFSWILGTGLLSVAGSITVGFLDIRAVSVAILCLTQL